MLVIHVNCARACNDNEEQERVAGSWLYKGDVYMALIQPFTVVKFFGWNPMEV